MADSTKTLADTLISVIKEADKKKTSPLDTTAEVMRIEDDTAWVRIPGGSDDTPVKLTINALPGDKVQIRIAKGAGWITGNVSNPPTDDRVANRAHSLAGQAFSVSVRAENEAERARLAADSAEVSAYEAKGFATEAKASATRANTHANSALTQLSIVEEVVETLEWIQEHGTYIPAEPIYVLTSDEVIVEGKKYYIRTGEEPDYIYVEVLNPVPEDLPNYYEAALDPKVPYFILDEGVFTPVAEPTIENIDYYYTLSIDESVTNFVSTHLAVTNGLYRETLDMYPKAYKTYFTRSGTAPNYTYTQVTNPTKEDMYRYVHTTDTHVDPSKVYYEASDHGYVVVVDPQDAYIHNYYEKFANYFEWQPGGLWVLMDNDSYKVLLSNDGMYLYDDTGRLITMFGSSILFDSDKPQFIGGEEAYIVYYDSDNDGIPDSIRISGEKVTIGGSTPLSDVIGGINIARNTLIYDHSYEFTNNYTQVVFEAFLYQGGVDVKTQYDPEYFTWAYRNETDMDGSYHDLGYGYTKTINLTDLGYGGHVIGRFTKPDDNTSELVNDHGDNLTTTDNQNLLVTASGESIRVRDLEKVTEIELTDSIMVVTSEQENLISCSDLSDYIDKSYVHNQNSASNEWTVTHNLRKYPTIHVQDSAGTNVIGDIEYIDANTLKIYFSSAFSGKAYCN